jgi:hypothetical protein
LFLEVQNNYLIFIQGKLSVAKLCSMTTMSHSDTDDKSIQSFRIPLEIIREDPKHEQHHYSSTPAYGGDLLTTVTYKRSIVKVIFIRYAIKKMSLLNEMLLITYVIEILILKCISIAAK